MCVCVCVRVCVCVNRLVAAGGGGGSLLFNFFLRLLELGFRFVDLGLHRLEGFVETAKLLGDVLQTPVHVSFSLNLVLQYLLNVKRKGSGEEPEQRHESNPTQSSNFGFNHEFSVLLA